jgi:hypothetical protein
MSRGLPILRDCEPLAELFGRAHFKTQAHVFERVLQFRVGQVVFIGGEKESEFDFWIEQSRGQHSCVVLEPFGKSAKQFLPLLLLVLVEKGERKDKRKVERVVRGRIRLVELCQHRLPSENVRGRLSLMSCDWIPVQTNDIGLGECVQVLHEPQVFSIHGIDGIAGWPVDVNPTVDGTVVQQNVRWKLTTVRHTPILPRSE